VTTLQPDASPVRRCTACVYADRLLPSGRLVCTEPAVNIPTPSYLAGSHATARSCIVERGVRRGVCGPAGLRFVPIAGVGRA
jgi:hypothetical protein